MPSRFTDLVKDKVLNHYFGSGTYTQGTSLSTSLHDDEPGTSGSTTHQIANVAPELTPMAAAVDAVAINSGEVRFTTDNVVGGPHTVSYVAASDSTGMLVYGEAQPNQQITPGTDIVMAPGAFAVGIDTNGTPSPVDSLLAFTDVRCNEVLDMVLGGSVASKPSSLRLSLHSNSSDADHQTGSSELSGGNYQRQTITFDAPEAGDITADARMVKNTLEVRFEDITGTPRVEMWGVWDQAGNLIATGEFPPIASVPENADIVFAAGEIKIQID